MSLRGKPSTVWVMAGVFGVIGLGLLAGFAYSLSSSTDRLTGPMVLLAFGWASLAMATSIVAAASLSSSRVVSAKSNVRHGVVTVEHSSLNGRQPAGSLTGPGAEATGEVTMRLGSRIPAFVLGLACLMLLVITVVLFVIGRATAYGAGLSLLMCFYMACWTKNALPRHKGELNSQKT